MPCAKQASEGKVLPHIGFWRRLTFLKEIFLSMRSIWAALAGALVLGFAPLAASADTGLVVGGVAGTTGFGASLGYVLPGGIVVRAQSGNFTINPNFNSNGNAYAGHLQLSNILIDGELHPGGKTFYVAAGGFLNHNVVTASTTSTGVTIGNTNYGAGTANARVTWQNFAPYVGFGFSPVHGGFGFDLGAAFQGNAMATVTSNIVGVTAADYAAAVTQIQKTLNGYTVYPVVNIRYTIGF
jgi:hypothetical protein